jgi:Ca2+-binding RTX toxin-like protein
MLINIKGLKMTINVTTIGEAEFFTRLQTCIRQFEGYSTDPYLDTSTVGGIQHATIGIGFDLVNSSVRTQVFDAMAVPAGVRASLTNIINNPPSTASALQSQLNTAYGQPFVMTPAQITTVFNNIITGYLNAAQTKSGLPFSDELVALTSVQFNGGDGLFGPGLTDALNISDPHEARAEAWYQIRYAHATDQNESRRYSEASIFGLYESPSGPVSKEEAVGIYRMYTHHYGESYDNNGGMINYDNAKSNNIGLSNGDLRAMGATFSGYSTQKLELELRRAADTIETEYLIPKNLSLDSINPLNIQVCYDDGVNPVITLTGEDNATRTGHIDDLLIGDANGNTLEGKSGNDILLGEDGADTLDGGKGNDTLEGGAGNDTYIYTSGDGFDAIVDSDGSGQIKVGTTVLTLAGSKKVGPNTWLSADGKYQYVWDGADAAGERNLYIHNTKDAGVTVSLVVKNFHGGNLGLNLTEAIDPSVMAANIIGDRKPLDTNPTMPGVQTEINPNTGNAKTDPNQPDEGHEDTLFDSVGNDRIQGLGGQDKLDAKNGGDDLLEGGEGSDVLLGKLGKDTLYANSQKPLADTFAADSSGTPTNQRGDLLSGGVDDDQLYGDVGNDALAGGAGGDTLLGGAGDDILLGDHDITDATISWTATQHHDPIPGGGIDHTFTLTGASYQEPTEGGDDVIYAGIGNDLIFSGLGNDIIDTGKDNDVAFAGGGDDVLLGQKGNDILVGDGYGANTPYGNDILSGGIGKPVSHIIINSTMHRM